MRLCVQPKFFVQVFLGTLRESEVERINDRISQAVMETCLAMTIFRDEFNVEFVAMFVILTFVKVFHWLVQDRVDYIETTPTVSRLHHMRIVSFMILLLVGNCVACREPVAQALRLKNVVRAFRVSIACFCNSQSPRHLSAVLQCTCFLHLSMLSSAP